MDRQTAMWTLVAFFGSAVAFNLVYQATEDSSRGVTFLAQLAVLALIVAFIVWLVRRRSDGGQ